MAHRKLGKRAATGYGCRSEHEVPAKDNPFVWESVWLQDVPDLASMLCARSERIDDAVEPLVSAPQIRSRSPELPQQLGEFWLFLPSIFSPMVDVRLDLDR
jgi:hypothetical protein